MGSTKVTDAVSALVTVLDAALSATVVDGPMLGYADVPVCVFVGYDDEPDSDAAASYGQELTAMSLGARLEVGSVGCVVSAYSGGTDLAGLRATARDTAIAVDAALQANPTLSGAVRRAAFGTGGALKQKTTVDGINARLTFTVDYEATV